MLLRGLGILNEDVYYFHKRNKRDLSPLPQQLYLGLAVQPKELKFGELLHQLMFGCGIVYDSELLIANSRARA